MIDFGLDVVSLIRIQYLLDQSFCSAFINNIFIRSEQQYFNSLCGFRLISEVASGFAIKEAVVKASHNQLATGDLKRITLIENHNGLLSKANRAVGDGLMFLVSVCHCGNSVIAVAGFEKYL
jgi:phosphopantetheinyl transferase (holo-ACP synthase)